MSMNEVVYMFSFVIGVGGGSGGCDGCMTGH